MGFSLGYNARGNPVLTTEGELPPLEGGAAWQILGGGGGVYRPEYKFAAGAIVGTPETGLTWSARIMSTGPVDTRVVTRALAVSAAVFAQDGTPLQQLGVQVVDDYTWALEAPPAQPGPTQAVTILVTAQRAGLITTLRTFAVLLVAGV